MGKDKTYYLDLLKKFSSSDYNNKLELYDFEFDILKMHESRTLVLNENGSVFLSKENDFNVLINFNSVEEKELFNKFIYSKVDDIVKDSRTTDYFRFHQIKNSFSTFINDISVNIFKIETLKEHINKKLNIPTALLYEVVRNEIDLVNKFIDQIENNFVFNQMKDLFNNLTKGNNIDFSSFDFGFSFEQFLLIRIAENFALYLRYLNDLTQEKKSKDLEYIEQKRVELIRNTINQVFEKGGIEKNDEDNLFFVLTHHYAPLDHKVKWKVSIPTLIQFIEDCKAHKIINIVKEDELGFIERCFEPNKKEGYIRHSLLTERSLFVKRKKHATFRVSFN